jgi:hypothetical protein
VREDILGHRLKSERAAKIINNFTSTEDTAVKEGEDAAKIISEEEEGEGISEPVKQEDSGYSFWINIPPITPEIRRLYR